MSIAPGGRRNLAEAAQLLLAHARMESDRGFKQDDRVFLMDSAEKAWNAVCHAVDHLMSAHGREPAVGVDAHATRKEFLEDIGRHDLSVKYAYFADTLHGSFFYQGRVPKTRSQMDRHLAEVEQFLAEVSLIS